MRRMRTRGGFVCMSWLRMGSLAIVWSAVFGAGTIYAQQAGGVETTVAPVEAGMAVAPDQSPAQPQQPPQPPQPAESVSPPTAQAAPETVTVAAGTKVLLALRSAVNTRSARAGDGVYLESTFPVVSNGRVVIPAGVYVQGQLDNVVRPGKVKGRAQITMHFTSMIFPNGSVVQIPGLVNSIPGSAGPQVAGQEGTIEQPGSKGKDAGTIAKTAAAGAGIGGLASAASGSSGLKGVGIGGGAGAAAGLLYTLFSRGPDLEITQGTPIEMVLQRPLVLQPENLAGVLGAGPGFGTTVLVPAAQQPNAQMLQKQKRATPVCPPGSLGCQ